MSQAIKPWFMRYRGPADDPPPGDNPPAPKKDDPPPGDNPPAPKDGDPAPGDNPPAAKPWPDDWRAQLSGGDEKVLKRLERFASPGDVWKSYRAIEQRISSGELKVATPPKDAKPEQIEAWKKENGLPLAAGDFKLTLGDGLTIGEDDKPIVESFLTDAALVANLNSDQASRVVDWYYKHEAAITEERHRLDVDAKKNGEDTLRLEWGQDYRDNIQYTEDLVAMGPKGMPEQFWGGRLADGTPIGSSPEVLQWLAHMSRQINPHPTGLPAGGEGLAKSIDDEIAQIKEVMTTNRRKYNADEKMQARYRDLLDAKTKLDARDKAGRKAA